MKRPRDLVIRLAVLLSALASPACVGTTGGDLVTFAAAAAGPADAVTGQPYRLPHPTDRGYEITLTQATLHLGALYLDSTVPTSGAQDTDCILPGVYVAQVTAGLDVDVLSPDPQPFPVQGQGIESLATTGEVWLMHGDVADTGDTQPILELAGTAVGPGGTPSFPFSASITIGENRLQQAESPATPSQHPICKEHIVSPILLGSGVTRDITPVNGGSLLLRIEPAGWFTNVDFARLAETSTSPPLYTFADATDVDQPSINLYENLHASRNSGVYDFFWIDAPNP
jgi:hypothetical protein